jgi:hypothetical protein
MLAALVLPAATAAAPLTIEDYVTMNVISDPHA